VVACYTRGVSRGPDDVHREVEAAIARARAAWPGVSVDGTAFAARLAELAAELPEAAWAALHVSDLYLAQACAEGDARALAAVEATIWPDIDAALARARIGEPRKDVLQDLRLRLFVSSDGRPGRILQYRGEGELRRWLQAAALREAFRRARQAKRETSCDDAALAAVAVLDRDAGLAHLKEASHVELKRAFTEALAALPRSDRILLRQYYVDRLTIDELGAIYRVHRTTASRQVARARAALSETILADFGRRMSVSDSERDSLVRLVRSQFDVTLDRLLSAD
jgi:RNA polymerase sigma-70 factor, ECF subfamily